MCWACTRYLGREIQWIGPEDTVCVGTVVDVWVPPGRTTLAVVNHATQAYAQVYPAFHWVELYDMPEEVYAELPEIIRDEVRYALESGLECSAPGCEELRLFGARECPEHALGADESWPDFHDEYGDHLDDWTIPAQDSEAWDYMDGDMSQ